MAENKKSFVLYADLIGRIEHLTKEEKGTLFQHLLEYVNDLNPTLEDRILIGVWKPIEQQLKRDLKKFEEVKLKRSEAGKRSAELRALKKEQQQETNLTSVKSVEQTSTNPTVSVNDNDNVNVSDNVINNIYIEDLTQQKQITEKYFLKRWKDAREYYDKKPTNIKKLTSFEKIDFMQLAADYEIKDFEKAMTGLFQQKTFPKTRLRPTHFLKREHFETYLTCFNTKEKLFEDKNYKKPAERI